MTKEDFTKGIIEKQKKYRVNKKKQERSEILAYRDSMFEKNRRRQRTKS